MMACILHCILDIWLDGYEHVLLRRLLVLLSLSKIREIIIH